MLRKLKKKVKSFSHFLWLFLLILVSILVTNFYENNKSLQYESLKKTLGNVYFQKSFSKITSKLEDRYIEIEYIVKEGDNYESIIEKIKISKKEKKKFLQTIKKNKEIKILKPNLIINLKIDKKDEPKIVNFIIEINKKRNSFY